MFTACPPFTPSMDDEQPPPTQLNPDDDDAQSSGDEDGGLDWTNLCASTLHFHPSSHDSFSAQASRDP